MPTNESAVLAERVARLREGLSSSPQARETLSNISATGKVEADQAIGAQWTQGWGQGWGQFAGYEGDA